jgi:hypothetical protein
MKLFKVTQKIETIWVYTHYQNPTIMILSHYYEFAYYFFFSFFFVSRVSFSLLSFLPPSFPSPSLPPSLPSFLLFSFAQTLYHFIPTYFNMHLFKKWTKKVLLYNQIAHVTFDINSSSAVSSHMQTLIKFAWLSQKCILTVICFK